ncbi:MAG: glycosyltransferase family 4 protein [Mobilitalea sp.]
MARIVFFCHDEKSNLEIFEYYKQDIDVLRTLEHKVIICTKYSEIPFDFDAMFIWWWTYALWPVLFSRMLKKPCIITGAFNFHFPEAFLGIDYLRRPYWQRYLIRKATSLCTLNLFINQIELKSCSEYFSLSNGRYYPCILHDDYLKGPSTRRRNVLINISWSGRNNLIRKGIPELLYAVRLLKDEGVEVNLTLAGHEGDGTDYLLEMIQQLKISDQVSYLGMISRTDKINLLRACEIYVQPSHFETFGLATAEAMGCGACVIICDVGAVREVVGDCGFYVSPGSPEELAIAIKQVLYDDKLRHKLQKSAHQRVSDCFAFDQKLERLKDYLSEVGIS